MLQRPHLHERARVDEAAELGHERDVLARVALRRAELAEVLHKVLRAQGHACQPHMPICRNSHKYYCMCRPQLLVLMSKA